MRELPILFSGPLVRSIYADDKDQTRRLPGLDHVNEEPDAWVHMRADGRLHTFDSIDGDQHVAKCPYGEPGDRLWVRETFAIDDYRYLPGCGPLPKTQPPDVVRVDVDEDNPACTSLYYRADGECCEQIPECQCRMDGRGAFWRPSIHMPRWASRLTLEVTEVRVQRVQECSESDARAEGSPLIGTHREWFRQVWDSLAKPGTTWADNPWVWCVSFRRLENDDA